MKVYFLLKKFITEYLHIDNKTSVSNAFDGISEKINNNHDVAVNKSKDINSIKENIGKKISIIDTIINTIKEIDYNFRNLGQDLREATNGILHRNINEIDKKINEKIKKKGKEITYNGNKIVKMFEDKYIRIHIYLSVWFESLINLHKFLKEPEIEFTKMLQNAEFEDNKFSYTKDDFEKLGKSFVGKTMIENLSSARKMKIENVNGEEVFIIPTSVSEWKRLSGGRPGLPVHPGEIMFSSTPGIHPGGGIPGGGADGAIPGGGWMPGGIPGEFGDDPNLPVPPTPPSSSGSDGKKSAIGLKNKNFLLTKPMYVQFENMENIKPENIKKGISVGGITGNYIPTNLKPENIKKGVNIDGIVGNYESTPSVKISSVTYRNGNGKTYGKRIVFGIHAWKGYTKDSVHCEIVSEDSWTHTYSQTKWKFSGNTVYIDEHTGVGSSGYSGYSYVVYYE